MKTVSSTGYLKRTATGEVFISPIYIGCWDSQYNYEQITKEEYEQAKAVEEATANEAPAE